MSDQFTEFYNAVANGNPIAKEFLVLWHDYCHEVDDIIDTPDWSHERVLGVFAMANRVYSHPFYIMHGKSLQPSVMIATSTFADSIKWEKDGALWKRWFADVMRHAGNEVIYATALICGGYDHLRNISAPLLAGCYVYHADKYGVPK